MTIKKLISFALATVLLTGSFAFKAFQQESQEYSLKAAFIYRFLDYIDWVQGDDENVVNIAILGESGIIGPLMQISRDKKIKGKRIRVKQYDNLSELGPCQILFVSKNYKYMVEPLTRTLKSILIISEQETDFDKGTHINFLISDNKLRFEVNLRTAYGAGLKVSSQLLQHALTVKR